MPLQKPHLRQLTLAACAAFGVWAFVKAGGAESALPALGLAWLGWQSRAMSRRWLRPFRTRTQRMTAEASGAGAYFAGMATAAALAGGGWGSSLAAVALCVLSVALEALDAEGPAVLWGVPVLAWVGPALPATDRAFSVPSGSVDDWLPVIGLSAIYVPLAAILLWRGSRP
jgi:hypothetical protein